MTNCEIPKIFNTNSKYLFYNNRLLKNGEKTITGHNFDTNLESSTQDENNDSKIKIKEDIMLSNKESALSSYSEIKEKVKFSDQLKKKVKNLKPLH